MSSSKADLGGCVSSNGASLDGGGVTDAALLSARDRGEAGSSVTSLKPSRYMEMASSTLMPLPLSMPYGASGVSGERSVMELLLVRTLLRSVPLFCSILDRDVMVELTLVRRVLSSAGPLDGNRGSGRPWGVSSWRRSGDSGGPGRLLFNREVDMDMRRPPLAGGALRWCGRSGSLSRGCHFGPGRSRGGANGRAGLTGGLVLRSPLIPCGEPA